MTSVITSGFGYFRHIIHPPPWPTDHAACPAYAPHGTPPPVRCTGVPSSAYAAQPSPPSPSCPAPDRDLAAPHETAPQSASPAPRLRHHSRTPYSPTSAPLSAPPSVI